jgi:DNA-directed RNA polymerase alpha subunit
MNQDIDVMEYFTTHGRDAPDGVLKRTVNGLVRGRITTMDELLGKTPEELARVRNIGAKCLEFTYLMRDKYVQETGKTPRGSLKEELSK